MTLKEKIEVFEKFLERLVLKCNDIEIIKTEKYNDYIDRMISLQNMILSLRRRKQRIEDRWVLRGDHE